MSIKPSYVLLCATLSISMCFAQDGDDAATANAAETPITLKVLGDWINGPKGEPATLTARFTSDELISLLTSGRPPSRQFEDQAYRDETIAAMRRVSMHAVVEQLGGYLSSAFEGRFNPETDLVVQSVPADKQVTIDTPDLGTPTFTGPQEEIIGILLHDISNDEMIEVALRMIHKGRQLLDTGNPMFDRTSGDYYRRWAEAIVAEQRALAESAAATQAEAERVRKEIAKALALEQQPDGSYTGDPNWLKESRRFSYIVQDGKFIQRLQPLVDSINRKMELAGFPAPSPLDKPGIFYDPEIGDVDIVLPEPMLAMFLQEADAYERRMAEDAIISIEAVRLTDRDIISGALAARLDAQVQGVSNVERFQTQRIFRELGLNSLLAVANQNLQVRTLRGVAAGAIPDGVSPVQIASPTLPPIMTGRTAATVGSTLGVGADPFFFDGREQVYGFSYLGTDGHEHTLTLEVVDSLTETWNRIERNLIVHKIKKTDALTAFSVPVGPDTKTYEGIAALISQENQQLVVATGTGAISEISATAGTWLVIRDFEISPIPGSSTTLTEDDRRETRAKVLLTMLLRDPSFPTEEKEALLRVHDRDGMFKELNRHFENLRYKTVREGRQSSTYNSVYDDRFDISLEEIRYTKREDNSVISLNFFSSQGNIVQAAGTTQLGDQNDLTSFTTLLRPNIVTPISSFFTKSGSNTKSTSPYYGVAKGEQKNEDKTMTHLVIRARFPTTQRENADRNEGRFVGYFDLPINREPSFDVDLPFLSSSEHPVERLAKLRTGLMFEVLDRRKVRKPFSFLNPQRFPGTVPREIYELAMSRMLLIRKIIADSPGGSASLATNYGGKFIVEVRSLLEYDEHFFDAPNQALRNMTQWNDPDRIRIALESSPKRFALRRLVQILDELGEKLIPDDYAHNYLAASPPAQAFGHRQIYELSEDQLMYLRRDVAAHYLRLREIYGDAFLEATCNILRLGTYRSKDMGFLEEWPFRSYKDLVVFDQGGRELGNPTIYSHAHKEFMYLKRGGYKGGLFKKSYCALEHLDDTDRSVIFRGRDILKEIGFEGELEQLKEDK